ncbi:MAG TPA: YbaK/EbsC family protein [Actinomycetota bacterium]|jgi:Ala-tRNA(Pro) deacylase|nr:YbaK/EbsC family protein [Actinomycetota bacterium]
MTTVREFLEQRGVPFEVIPHDRAYTSIDEARALGISADEVVKTVVLDTASGHALAVIPGSRRLHMRLVRKAVGDNRAKFADEDEMERDFPDLELGAFPPLGSMFGAPTYVDPEVFTHETVVFGAGSQKESVKVRTEDLFRDEPVTKVPLTRESAPPEE